METAIITTNIGQTKKIASRLAKEIILMQSDCARVIALEGNLGAGKTTFVQGFAHALGITEKIQSPTFVLMKIYSLNKQKYLKHLVHIDAYRLETPKELEHLGFRELLQDRDGVILIEWADRVKKLLPKDTTWITFEHGEKLSERVMQIKAQNIKVKRATHQ